MFHHISSSFIISHQVSNFSECVLIFSSIQFFMMFNHFFFFGGLWPRTLAFIVIICRLHSIFHVISFPSFPDFHDFSFFLIFGRFSRLFMTFIFSTIFPDVSIVFIFFLHVSLVVHNLNELSLLSQFFDKFLNSPQFHQVSRISFFP